MQAADQLEATFDRIRTWPANGLTVLADAFLVTLRANITRLAAYTQLPTVYAVREYVEAGGLMSYGPDTVALYRRAASYADKVLRGANPADLPVEQPTSFEFAVNAATAQSLGLTFPPEAAAQVTAWVQ